MLSGALMRRFLPVTYCRKQAHGRKMGTMIPHSRPAFDERDAQAVAEVVRSGFVAEGEKVRLLEKKVAGTAGKKFGAAASSGTAALHLSLLSLGIGPGDAVALPSYVCSSLLHAVRMAGADPLLVDALPGNFHMDPAHLEKNMTAKTKAVIVPHPFGFPTDLAPFKKMGIPVIEDCAQSIGATLGGRPAGSFGDISIFSFYATKVLAAGEGGMACSDSEEIISRARDLRGYDNKDDDVRRFNYKLTDLQAALGISQLEKLAGFIQRRREIARRYDERFASLPLILPSAKDQSGAIYFRYIVRLSQGRGVDDFINQMKKEGVVCMRPIHTPLHRILGQEGFPSADEAWERSVSIPLYPALRKEDAERVMDAVHKCFAP